MRPFLSLLICLAINSAAGAQQQSASIKAIAPTFGPPGTTVSIRGAGFSSFEPGSPWVKELASEPPPGAVQFNGVTGDILFWEDDLITVKVPKGASTGAVRVILPSERLVLTADEFEVYYSTPAQTPTKPSEYSEPDATRSSDAERRLTFDTHVPPALPFYASPWFSSLSPGERTFLGEQGFTNTALFGNPFSLGRKQSFLSGDGFISGRDRFARPGFDRFRFQDLFFLDFLFRSSRDTSIRPFWFFFDRNRPSSLRNDGHIFRR